MSNIPEDLSFQILEHIQNKADIEMDLYQKSLNMNSEESVHAMLHVPYYETEEFKSKIQDIMQSQREIKARVQEIEFNFEVERQSRVESEKKQWRWPIGKKILIAFASGHLSSLHL